MVFTSWVSTLRPHPHRARRAMRRGSFLRTAVRCVVTLAWHTDHGTGRRIQLSFLGGCRAWSAESENRPQRDQFLPDLQPNS